MQKQRRAFFPLMISMLALAQAAACAKREPPLTEVVVVRGASLPTTPSDAAWPAIPVYTAALLLQDMVEPRLLVPSTPRVHVQAMSDGARIAFRLSWTDSTQDDLPGPGRFVDACAVQLPTQVGPNLPAPQMGETGGPIVITYWSAAWQAQVDGRPDSIRAFYPNATVDHYPFEAASLDPKSPEHDEMVKRYRPAEGAHHPQHAPGQPVQDLMAEGPGTLTAAERTSSEGEGHWQRESWAVVILRQLPEALRGEARSQVAFAIWNGSHDEVGARKMRSAWIPMALEAQP